MFGFWSSRAEVEHFVNKSKLEATILSPLRMFLPAKLLLAVLQRCMNNLAKFAYQNHSMYSCVGP